MRYTNLHLTFDTPHWLGISTKNSEMVSDRTSVTIRH